MISPVKRKSGVTTLFQLLLVVGFLSFMWFSFGQNVLAPRAQSGVPKQWGEMVLASSTGGSEALTQINKLHGTNIELVSAYIAEYAHSSPYHNVRATVWVGKAENPAAAAELVKRMQEAIGKGGTPFTNLQRLTLGGNEVFQVSGSGGEHFFYNSNKTEGQVVWLTIQAPDAISIMEEAMDTF